VFVGDTIECLVTLTSTEPGDGFVSVTSDWKCTNQHGKEVMSGTGSGIIRQAIS